MSQTPLDFSAYITDRTRDFVGREWVFAEIDRWLATPDAPHYFIITGEPGIGKTAIAARLTQIRDLAATHFCIARQADTIDPLNFARSLSHQLTRIAGFAQCLLSSGDIHLEAHQTIQEVHGRAINVYIESLRISTPSATAAFTHTVIEPLKALYASGFDRRTVILVDALDEAIQFPGRETIVDVLVSARGLPSQVRFVLTSRPESSALRHFERLDIPHLVLNAGREESLQDVREYVRSCLEASKALEARLAERGMRSQVFIERVAEASMGNFLYLVWLLPAIAEGTQRFDELEALPKGLDGIYREFLRTRKVGKDIDRYRARYRPLLGTLVAAREPLWAEQLARFTGLSDQEVHDFLLDVQQFLDPPLAATGQYRLYHQSVADFLGNKEQAQEFWIDPAQIHRQIVDCCRGGASIWEAVNWEQAGDYEKRHLAAHLYELRDVESCRQDLYALVESQSWTTAKYVDTPWAGSLIQDLQFASAIAAEGNIEDWARSMGYQLRRAIIEQLMSRVSRRTILFLVRLGEVERALDFARRRWDSFKLLREIARAVASTQPAKAVDVLAELAHLYDNRSASERCTARLAAAQEILRLAPSHQRVALDLIEEARHLEHAIPEPDLVRYRVVWDLPTLALRGELSAALAASNSLPPLQQAQALRHISLALPQDHPSKRNLLEQALSVLKALEQTPEVASEKMKALVALLPLVGEGERKGLLNSLESAGDYLHSVEAPVEHAAIPHWAVGRVAPIDLDWARCMLLESKWGSTPDVLYEVAQEIAHVDYEEALQIARDRLSNHVLTPQLLVHTIGIVAAEDTGRAEALIEEYAERLRDDKDDAHIAVAEAYLARGDTQKAREIFDEHAVAGDSESLVHARGDLQLAILARSGGFLSVEAARDRLMQFPACPRCHQDREQEAERILARIAARQGRIGFLEEHHFDLETQLAAAYDLADYVGPEAAREYLERRHITPRIKGTERVYAHIAAVEAQQDATKLEILLRHFDDNGRSHHFCDYMKALPQALCTLVRTNSIEVAEARAVIERVYSLLVDYECPQGAQSVPQRLFGGRCSCYDDRDLVLAHLVGIMAQLDPSRSEQMVDSLPSQPVKVYALKQTLHHTRADEELVSRIIEVSQESIQDPWQRAASYYDLTTLLPAQMRDLARYLIELAEPLLDEEPIYETDEFGMRTRVGPSRTELKIRKAQALIKLIGNVAQFADVAESLRPMETLLQLDDKLRILDTLTNQALEWSKEDRLALLWQVREAAINKGLMDVQALIAFAVPLVHSLAGEAAFWRLYDYVEWAYQGLPPVGQGEAEGG